MIVFKTKFRPTPRGVKIISKSDRKEMIDALNKLCHNRLNKTLEEVLVEITERDYTSSPSGSHDYLFDNIRSYVSGEAGIGLSLLGKLAERVGFTCVFQVKFPSRESTLIIDEG